jgi:hypothetical protein
MENTVWGAELLSIWTHYSFFMCLVLRNLFYAMKNLSITYPASLHNPSTTSKVWTLKRYLFQLKICHLSVHTFYYNSSPGPEVLRGGGARGRGPYRGRGRGRPYWPFGHPALIEQWSLLYFDFAVLFSYIYIMVRIFEFSPVIMRTMEFLLKMWNR